MSDIKDNNDLTYYKQIYQELKLILDATYDEITITDGDGVFLRVSKSCDKTFGIKDTDMIGTSAYELEKQGIFSKSSTVEVLKKKEEVTLVQTTGSGKRLVVTGIPMFDNSGNLIRVLNICRDITDEDKLKKRLNKMETSLEWYRNEIRKNRLEEYNPIVSNSSQMNSVMEIVNQMKISQR
ncbi:PAS domain-containing protein [Natranaerobius trueperi]|uniref:PAC domain-containing protein n=1 Tax=Natranaerobius trueperi TaxID=759412 RepID=A0A226BWH6_9FIRM|nr:PAS domain-containing protein [Natranaerobius trueperi]OWZ83353.1 hypothetical protein CDO51_09035 [Natranaerobius trueperi]